MKKRLLVLAISVSALAAGVFLAVDRQQSSGNLLLANIEALAQGGENSQLWFRTDEDCIWSGTSSSNSSISITVRGETLTLGTDRNGKWEYKISGGKTRCESNGHEQCTAKYCD